MSEAADGDDDGDECDVSIVPAVVGVDFGIDDEDDEVVIVDA